MAAVPVGQFEVVLSDGLRIDRLPPGLAAGRWWVTFVFAGVDFAAGSPPRFDYFFTEVRRMLRIDGPAGQVTALGGGGGGNENVQHAYFDFRAEGLDWLRVTYLDNGEPVATETLDLS